MRNDIFCYEQTKMNITKLEVAKTISRETGIPIPDVLAVLDKFMDCIISGLAKGSHFEFRNFGSFVIREARPRKGRNPKKPDRTFTVPARKIVKFRMSKKLREMLNQPGRERT